MFGMQPGFRFRPTDVELVLFYLKRKILGKPLHCNVIAELDLYKFPPWDLPGKSLLQSNDLEWYFLCPHDKKYSSGSRTNRSTETGFWKSTGRARDIAHKSKSVGTKKTLVFHVGQIPRGERTNWVMYEYQLAKNELVNVGFRTDSYVLCRIFQKSGPGPKNGEQYGAPFKEEDWENIEVSEEPCMSQPIEPTEWSQLLQEPVIQQCSTSRVPVMPCTSVASDFERSSEQPYEACGIASCIPANGHPSLMYFNSTDLLQQLFCESNSDPHFSEVTDAELSDLHTSFTEVSAPENLEKDELPDLSNGMEREQNFINDIYQNLEELEPIDGVYFSDIIANENYWSPLPAASNLQYDQQQDSHFWDLASLYAPEDVILEENSADNSYFKESHYMVLPSSQSLKVSASSSIPGGSQPKRSGVTNEQQNIFQEIDCLEADAASASATRATDNE